MADGLTKAGWYTGRAAPTVLITAGTATVVTGFTKLTGGSSGTHDLDTINIGAVGTTVLSGIMYLTTFPTQTIVLKHNVGNIFLSTGADISFTENEIFELFYNADTALWSDTKSVASGAAPDDATYILQTADAGLTNAQALSPLETGEMDVEKTTGIVTSRKHNLNAGIDPTGTDDSNANYSVGSLWINTTLSNVFRATDVTPSNAVWEKLNNEELLRVVGATYDTIQDYVNLTGSAGWTSGGAITDNLDGTVDIAAGTGMIRNANSNLSNLLFFNWAATPGLVCTNQVSSYVYVDYNAGSPIVSIQVGGSGITDNENTKFELYEIFREGTDLHITSHTQTASNSLSLLLRKDYSGSPLRRDEGLIVGESGTRNITVSSGVLWAKLSKSITPALDTSLAGGFNRYYLASGAWVKQSAQTQWNNTQYNNVSTPGAESLATISVNKFSFQDFFIEFDGSITCVFGQGQYNSLDIAEQEPRLSNLPPLLNSSHSLFMARLYFQVNDTSAQEIVSAFITPLEGGAASSHNNLSDVTPDQHHNQQHALNSTSDHTGTATEDNLLSADANGLPKDSLIPSTSIFGGSRNRLLDSIDYQWGPTTIDSTTLPPNNDFTPVFGRWTLLSDGDDVVDITRENTFLPDSGSQYYAELTITAAGANKKWGIMSVLSADNSIPLRDTIMSLQAKLRTVAGSQVTWIRYAILEWSGTADEWTGTDPISAWNAAGVNPTLAANWAYAGASINLGPGIDVWDTEVLENVTTGGSFNNLGVIVWLDDTNKGVGKLLQITQAQLEIGSVATAFVPSVRSDYPKRATMWHENITIISGSSGIVKLQNGTQMHAIIVYQNPRTDGDAFTQSVFLKAGLYTFQALGRLSTDGGKIDWYIDSTLVISGQDWYASITTYNIIYSDIVPVLFDGYHQIKGVVNGKNASSSSYTMIFINYSMVPAVG